MFPGVNGIIDRKVSISLLKAAKQMLEHPSELIFGGKDPFEVVLNL